MSRDPREPFESIALCEHLASTLCFNPQIWGCNWSIKERFSLRFLYALLHKSLSCLNLKTALFCRKKKLCYGAYLDKSSFILFFGVLWIFMSFDGAGDGEGDVVRTQYIHYSSCVSGCFHANPERQKNVSVLEGTEPSSSQHLALWSSCPSLFQDKVANICFVTVIPFFFIWPPKFSLSTTRYWRSVKI